MKKFKFKLEITERDLRKWVRNLLKFDRGIDSIHWKTIEDVEDTLYKCMGIWSHLDKICDLVPYMNTHTRSQMYKYMLDYYNEIKED